MVRLESRWLLATEFGTVVIPFWRHLLVTIPNNRLLHALQMGDAPSAWSRETKSEAVQDFLYTTLGTQSVYILCQIVIRQLSMPRVAMLASNLLTRSEE